VDEYTLHRVSHYQPSPFSMCCQALGEKPTVSLNQLSFSFRLCGREAIAAARCCWACADSPKLGQNLRRIVKLLTSGSELPKRIKHKVAVRVIPRNQPKKNVRINEERHSVFGKVDILAGKVAWKWWYVFGH
jgi:hypothetical protein